MPAGRFWATEAEEPAVSYELRFKLAEHNPNGDPTKIADIMVADKTREDAEKTAILLSASRDLLNAAERALLYLCSDANAEDEIAGLMSAVCKAKGIVR